MFRTAFKNVPVWIIKIIMLSGVLACFEFAFWNHRLKEKKEKRRIKEGRREEEKNFQLHERTIKILNEFNSSGCTCPSLCRYSWIQRSKCCEVPQSQESIRERLCYCCMAILNLKVCLCQSAQPYLEAWSSEAAATTEVTSFIGQAFCLFYWHWRFSSVPLGDGL